ncbi:MAG: Aspartate kinase [Phycisphaerae bacterium]|nr:Aspartate kinase [Phycisphaerae bacterium]
MRTTSTHSWPIVVIKLGGSVLTDVSAYARAAEFVARLAAGEPRTRFIVVVSAQEGLTDALLSLARDVAGGQPAPVALDLLWSTGELRSVALLTLALSRLGVEAVGLNVHQCGLIADPEDGLDNEVRVDALPLLSRLAAHRVLVAPGFLARAAGDSIATLGRGGSDLTAVLLAAGLNAERCELIKDVPGYFTADPHRDSSARPIPRLTHAEALRMAADGCDLVQPRAVRRAAELGLRLVVRSADPTAPSSSVEAEFSSQQSRVLHAAG